ncbi:hypothetical protein GWN42_31265 [candidate division KSB1 bacterium]|nr:hypothetical protein [Phycisphaerae bacterium]NIQ92539.1 hypothetical protein [Deltaproteobacteria bacterium]NIV97149.1 hypothetical protein [candidate division KSB1 bacterium]
MFKFLCKHPFKSLAVEKDQTSQYADEDFEHITYHLFCRSCGKSLPLTYAKCIGGVDAFFDRGREKQISKPPIDFEHVTQPMI